MVCTKKDCQKLRQSPNTYILFLATDLQVTQYAVAEFVLVLHAG